MHVQGNYYEGEVRKLFNDALSQFTGSYRMLSAFFLNIVSHQESARCLSHRKGEKVKDEKFQEVRRSRAGSLKL